MREPKKPRESLLREVTEHQVKSLISYDACLGPAVDVLKDRTKNKNLKLSNIFVRIDDSIPFETSVHLITNCKFLKTDEQIELDKQNYHRLPEEYNAGMIAYEKWIHNNEFKEYKRLHEKFKDKI